MQRKWFLCPGSSPFWSVETRKWEGSENLRKPTALLTITTHLTTQLQTQLQPLKMQHHYCCIIWWLSTQILSWSSISKPSSVSTGLMDWRDYVDWGELWNVVLEHWIKHFKDLFSLHNLSSASVLGWLPDLLKAFTLHEPDTKSLSALRHEK